MLWVADNFIQHKVCGLIQGIGNTRVEGGYLTGVKLTDTDGNDLDSDDDYDSE